MRKKLWIEKPSAYGERTTAIFPSLDLFRHYRREWFMGDMTAGLLIFATTIPAALAYGELAGLKHVNGLYASLLAMGVYALVGTSRQLIVDSEAAVAILVATSVASVYAGGDPVRFAAFAFLQAIMVGADAGPGGGVPGRVRGGLHPQIRSRRVYQRHGLDHYPGPGGEDHRD